VGVKKGNEKVGKHTQKRGNMKRWVAGYTHTHTNTKRIFVTLRMFG